MTQPEPARTRRRIAFYAPMKPPDHPSPSGDRQVARNLMAALAMAGHEVELASGLQTYLRDPGDSDTHHLHLEAAKRESARLDALWSTGGAPDLWVSYHPYHKSPDLIGPGLCRRHGVPWITVEASQSARRSVGCWADFQERALDAVRGARINICFTRRDMKGLLETDPSIRVAHLPPFIDTAPFREAAPAPIPGHLVTVAMMREGDKLDSYAMLAEALRLLPGSGWQLSHRAGTGDAAMGNSGRQWRTRPWKSPVLPGDCTQLPAGSGSTPDRLKSSPAVDAMRMALQNRKLAPGPICRSDLGIQYASGNCRQLPDAWKAAASMRRKGDCLEFKLVPTGGSDDPGEPRGSFEGADRADGERPRIAEGRAGAPHQVPVPPRGQGGAVRLHCDLLQSPPPPLDHGTSHARADTDRHGRQDGRSVNICPGPGSGGKGTQPPPALQDPPCDGHGSRRYPGGGCHLRPRGRQPHSPEKRRPDRFLIPLLPGSSRPDTGGREDRHRHRRVASQCGTGPRTASTRRFWRAEARGSGRPSDRRQP
ncbi:hypothetical protein [Mangrovicoccus ximenensis]